MRYLINEKLFRNIMGFFKEKATIFNLAITTAENRPRRQQDSYYNC
jgi:hypothetical protein